VTKDGMSGVFAPPSGIKAFSGGGSGEVIVTWDPLPAGVGVAQYRVYENRHRAGSGFSPS
jgi:hypothetical protein